MHLALRIIACLLLTICVVGCGNENSSFGKISTPRSQQAQLAADSVATLISDSGVTKYRISSARWLIFDKAKEPYWFFPQGLKLEKFDSTFAVDASMWADTAIYYQPRDLWEFRGHVSAQNLQDERFLTSQLFWDNAGGRFYSDRQIRIMQRDQVIEGVGFESNASLTQYVIKRPTGIFPLSDKEQE